MGLGTHMGREVKEQASCPGLPLTGPACGADFRRDRSAGVLASRNDLRRLAKAAEAVEFGPLAPKVPTMKLFVQSVLAITLLASCTKDDKSDHGAPPPPPPETHKPGACVGGGGEVDDAISRPFFARSVAGYCIDPQGQTRTYGEKGKLDMEAVCTTAFDGECAVYNQFGLKRLVALRYVDGEGGAGGVEVYLSRFEDEAGSFGMFTKRVVADADPAEPTTPKPLEAGARGAIGTGRAYVWKGSYLAELQYNNEEETPEALAASSAKILSAVARETGGRLPGGMAMPPAAAALPTENLVPNGVQFYPKDAPSLGKASAAVGFYRDGAKRYRMVAVLRDDAAAAKETMKAVRSAPGWLPVASLGEEACATTTQAKSEYVYTRQGSRVLGVGDEELARGPGKELSKDEKVALLKKWLSAPRASPH
jgi:hypothetical protein